MLAFTVAPPSSNLPPAPAAEPGVARILVADQDAVNARVLGHILRREGYALGAAKSAKRLLEVYTEFQPDIVLLDAELPGDGFGACRTLRETHGPRCAAIMFLTAKASPDDVVAGLAAGAADYLRKPFNPREVVARLRAQLRHRQLIARQASIVAELDAANQEKNRVLNLAAHDLRTPLASMWQLAGFLREGTLGPLPPDQQDLIETIAQTSGSMLDMVDELLDVVAIESGALKLNCVPTDLGLLIDRAVYVANISAAKKNSRILFMAPITSNSVSIDPAKMKQVVDNLLSNAIKYSPPGSIITAEMHLDFAGGGFSFSVRDQGAGIPEHERDKLFKDFGRLSVKPTGGEKSTGLGLAICRKIVVAHGGAITAENLPEGGAEFRVTVPSRP